MQNGYTFELYNLLVYNGYIIRDANFRFAFFYDRRKGNKQ